MQTSICCVEAPVLQERSVIHGRGGDLIVYTSNSSNSYRALCTVPVSRCIHSRGSLGPRFPERKIFWVFLFSFLSRGEAFNGYLSITSHWIFTTPSHLGVNSLYQGTLINSLPRGHTLSESELWNLNSELRLPGPLLSSNQLI